MNFYQFYQDEFVKGDVQSLVQTKQFIYDYFCNWIDSSHFSARKLDANPSFTKNESRIRYFAAPS